MPAPVASTSVEAWGRPVYKKKWLFGKWKYSGMSDVKYVPRTHAVPAPLPIAAPTFAPVPVAPACGYDAGCGAGYDAGCGAGYDAGCGAGYGAPAGCYGGY